MSPGLPCATGVFLYPELLQLARKMITDIK